MLLLTTLIVQAILAIFISGILYGFSDFIMRAFNNLSSKNAVAAMQNVNETVYRSLFMVIFMLLVPISITSAVWSIVALGWADSLFAIVGMLTYIFGVFMVTGAGNVPLNESLKHIDANSREADNAWMDYYKRWTRLNTLRCVFGVVAGTSWILAVYINL